MIFFFFINLGLYLRQSLYSLISLDALILRPFEYPTEHFLKSARNLGRLLIAIFFFFKVTFDFFGESVFFGVYTKPYGFPTLFNFLLVGVF